jgi:RNA polymerase primary sigma factor
MPLSHGLMNEGGTLKTHCDKRKQQKKSAGNDISKMYMRELNNHAPISREEEHEIAKKAVSGDTEARNKLIKSNLRFVVAIAKQYQGRGLHLDDLISEGNLGLVTAADYFDPGKGCHFITYAIWWIRQAILKAIYDKSHAIRLPVNRIADLIQIERAGQREKSNLTADSEIKRVAQQLNMPEKDVRLLLWISQTPVSLDAPTNCTNPDSPPIAENVRDNDTPAPDETAINRFMLDDIERLLDTLTDREASVIRYHYGLGGRAQMSLCEVGRFLGLTKERARQLEKKALKHLSSPKMADRLKHYCA